MNPHRNTNNNGPEHGPHKPDLQSKETDWESPGKPHRTDWKKLIVGKTKEEAITSFQDHCVKKSYEHAPEKAGKPPGKKRRIPRDRRTPMRRTKADKQIRKNPPREKLKERAETERKIPASPKNERKRKEKATEACKRTPKHLPPHAKQLSKVRQNVGPTTDKKGEAIPNEEDMAENTHEQYETWSDPTEPPEDAAKMSPDEEETEETTEQTTRDTDFNINDIKDAMGDLDEIQPQGRINSHLQL